jgi:hypothetical protein
LAPKRNFRGIKGTVSRDFYQRHRREIFPPVPLVLLIPAANLPQVLPQVSTTPRQRMGTISDCQQLKVNLKEKIYLYANSSTQRCSKEIMKIFLIEDFFHLLPVSMSPVVHLELRISPRIFEKFETALMV